MSSGLPESPLVWRTLVPGFPSPALGPAGAALPASSVVGLLCPVRSPLQSLGPASGACVCAVGLKRLRSLFLFSLRHLKVGSRRGDHSPPNTQQASQKSSRRHRDEDRDLTAPFPVSLCVPYSYCPAPTSSLGPGLYRGRLRGLVSSGVVPVFSSQGQRCLKGPGEPSRRVPCCVCLTVDTGPRKVSCTGG